MEKQQKRLPKLDDRLLAALAMAPSFEIFADIGADHGQLSAAILASDPGKRALIADVSEKALAKARKCIDRHDLSDRAIFCVADGLDALDALSPLRADIIFILGMGGDTISGILRRGASKLGGATVILGAQTELPLLRQTLRDIGYFIDDERIAKADRYSYILMRCRPAADDMPAYTEAELLLGPILMRDAPPSWLPVLERRKRMLEHGIEAMAGAATHLPRIEAFRRELSYIEAAIPRVQSAMMYEESGLS